MRNNQFDMEMKENQVHLEEATGTDHIPDQVADQVKAKVAEQMQQQKFVFQLVDHESGQRSEPFITTWDELYDLVNDNLAKSDQAEKRLKDYVLLVCVLEEQETVIPGTPLITVQSFLDLHNQRSN